MALPPVICNEECHTKRIRLYLFYSAFLASLLLLVLLHFVIFLSSRRKSKYEAREYQTRKIEFGSGVPRAPIPSTEKESTNGIGDQPIEDGKGQTLQESVTMSPEPSTSASTSALNRILAVNGIGSVPLQKIEEESIAKSQHEANNHTPYIRYSSSYDNIQDRTIIGALQEPVIVTVATVSALFQQHEINESPEQRTSSSQSSESSSSGLDISDLVNSPGRTSRQEEAPNHVGDWGARTDRGDGLHKKHQQMLDVRIGGGARGGFLKSQRRGESFSADAIFPASGAAGIYDTDHIV